MNTAAAGLPAYGISRTPGAIQVIEATWRLLLGRYKFEDRGEIEVKGKGRCRAYLLVGRASR